MHPDLQYMRGVVLVFAATLCFAFQPVFGHIAYADEANVTGLLWLRFLFAATVLHIWHWREKHEAWWKPTLIGTVLSCGALFYFSALQTLSVGLTTLLFFLFPVYIFLFSFIRRTESLSLLKILAVFTAISGVYISVDTRSELPLIGILFGLIAGACYGAYIMLSNRYLSSEKPFAELRWVTTGGLILFTFPALSGQIELPSGINGYGAAIGLSLICTLLSMALLLTGTKLMQRSTDVSVIATTEIGSTLVLAWLLLNEPLRSAELVGAMLVFLAAVIIVLDRRREQVYLPD